MSDKARKAREALSKSLENMVSYNAPGPGRANRAKPDYEKELRTGVLLLETLQHPDRNETPANVVIMGSDPVDAETVKWRDTFYDPDAYGDLSKYKMAKLHREFENGKRDQDFHPFTDLLRRYGIDPKTELDWPLIRQLYKIG